MANELGRRSSALYGVALEVAERKSDRLRRGIKRGRRQLVRRRVLSMRRGLSASRRPLQASSLAQSLV